MKKQIWILLIGIIMASFCLAPVWADDSSQPAQIERTTVSGMTVLLQKNKSQLAEVTLLLKSGSGLDPADKQGVAELMNQFVYIYLRQSDNELGQLSVSTYPEFTLISIRTTTSNLKDVLQSIKDLLTSRLYNYDFITDLKNLLGTDLKATSVLSRTYFNLVSEFYGKNHPYNNQLTPESIAKINGTDVYKWYRQTYQPGNALLSISGGVSQSISEIGKFYSDMQSESVDRRLMIEPVTVKQDKTIRQNDPNGRVAAICIGYGAPRIQDPDFPAFRLLSYYLGEYQYYFEALRVKEGLFYAGDVYYNYLEKPKAPMIAFYSMTDPSLLNQVLTRTREVVTDITTQGIPQEELKKVVNAIRLQNKANNATGKGAATRNALSHYLQTKMVYDDVLLAKLEQVTTEDIKKVAAKYFTHSIQVAYVPQNMPDNI